MERTDIEFYNNFCAKNLRYDEIYLGRRTFPWNFSKIGYAANCIEKIRLNVFDRAICGLLKIEGSLTVQNLGAILGLNVEENADKGIYRDDAEVDILNIAIKSLESEFEMIRRTNPFSDEYTLTFQGMKFYQNGFKEIIHNNIVFNLFFDDITHEHSEAKKIFSNVDGVEYSSRDLPEYGDINELKKFMYYQEPMIYNEDTGSNFSDLHITRSSHRTINISVGLKYNWNTKEYTLCTYVPGMKPDYFNKALNNAELKSEAIKLWLSDLSSTRLSKPVVQEVFENGAMKAQTSVDSSLSKKKSVVKIKEKYEESRNVYAEEMFWSKLDTYIPQTAKEVFFFVENLTDEILSLLNNLSNLNENMTLYVSYIDSNTEFDEYYSRAYFTQVHSIENGLLCACDNGLSFSHVDFIYDFSGTKKIVKVVLKSNNKDLDISKFKMSHARRWLPLMIENAMNMLNKDFQPVKGDIDFIRDIDNDLNLFVEFTDKLNLNSQLDALHNKQNNILEYLYETYGREIANKVYAFIESVEIDKIRKIDALNKIFEHIKELKKDVSPSQVSVVESIKQFELKLREREKYMQEMILSKTYIIDTNVFLDDPRIISKLSIIDKAVVSIKVLDEIDKHKIHKDPKIRENVKTATHELKKYREKKNGKVFFERGDFRLLPEEYSAKNPDNMILSVALAHKNLKENICMLTSDVNFQLKADACNIPYMSLDDFGEYLEKKHAEMEKLKNEKK